MSPADRAAVERIAKRLRLPFVDALALLEKAGVGNDPRRRAA
jgi:hypothetical protein